MFTVFSVVIVFRSREIQSCMSLIQSQALLQVYKCWSLSCLNACSKFVSSIALFSFIYPCTIALSADGGLVSLGKKVLQCMCLPEHNEDFISGLLLLLEGGDIQVYPPSTTEVALRTADDLYMYTADPATGAMEGIKFFKSPQKVNVFSSSLYECV